MRVSYFADVMPGAAGIRLAAAVVWRLTPDGAQRGARRWGRWPVAWLRRLRHKLWLRLGPLGIDVQWPGSSPQSGGGSRLTSVSLRGDDEATAYYDGRAVRVFGRVYRLPAEGRSLVLLVDAGRRSAARITARTVPAPMAPGPLPPPEALTLDQSVASQVEIDARTDLVVGGDRPEWEAALLADPEVRAFMEADRR